jgi:hypothetical protein
MLWEPTAPLLCRIVVNGGRAAAGAAGCRAEGSGAGAVVPRAAVAEDAKPGPDVASPAAPLPLPRPLPSPAPCISASLCPLLLRCQHVYLCTSKASKPLLPLCHAAPIRCSSGGSFFVFTALLLVTGRGHETGEFFFALDTKSPPTSTSRGACPPSRTPRAS